MADYTTKDAVEFAVDGKSGEFKSAIHDILADRVQSAIEIKKLDVTANFMSPQKEDEVAVDEPQEVEVPADETTEV